MKFRLITLFIIVCCLIPGLYEIHAQQLAFPGAEGFGKYATGGRTGTVYRVTNLNDSGPGSLRDAVSQPNRIVVFDVAGVIRINTRIVVKNNIYIAGQTAPGEGITVYGNGFSFSGASNVICRYIRIRMGIVGDSGKDAVTMESGSDMIFDHVSVAWGRDETFSVTGSVDNITIQNSIISQGLLPHSAGGLIEPSGKVTIYRTLYLHNDTRNPKFKLTHQYVNNIVYNWKSAAYIMGGESNARSYANAVGNYFITGIAGSTVAFSGGNDKYSIYAKDNWVDKNRNGIQDGYAIPRSEYGGGPSFVETAYDYPELPTIPALDLYADLVKTVGASLPYRDNLDWNLINDLSSFGTKGSIISNENDLLIGNPETWNLWEGEIRKDTDGDGIPDEWEINNGLDPNDPSDAMKLLEGYANIEHYINSITVDNSQFYLKAPLCLQAVSTTLNEIQLEWLDYTDLEDGYIIEKKIDDVFHEIARVGKDVNTYTEGNLLPESIHVYRVKGYKNSPVVETAYTNELIVQTRPVPVNVTDPDTYVPDVVWAKNSGDWDIISENWADGKKFMTGNNVLFNNVVSDNENIINLPEAVDQGTIMIKGDADYIFTGSAIGGEGSLNKTGKGKITLGAENNYTGATVIWDGVMEINKLANGGQASSIGASQNYDFNWIWNGGKIRYTGGTVTTDRNVILENATDFEIINPTATVTIDGIIKGDGDFIKSGSGKFSSTFGKHTYTGNTIVKEGVYELKGNYAEVGLKGKLILEGGTFRTIGGADGKDGIFSFPVEVNGDKISYFEPTRNSQIKSKFSGFGNLQINVAYVREFYSGNWDEYYGNLTVDVNGQEFMLSSSIPNAHISLKNGAMKAGSNALSIRLGALSGDASASIVCSHVKTAGGAATWIVGGLNTDEEFKGVISSGVTHSSRKGRSNIVKEGTGYWRLTNTNKYLGTTTVDEGTLIINGSHVSDKDVTTVVEPGAYTVNAGGTLAGNGTINSALTVKNGGFLTPGDFGIGTFKVNKATTLEKGSMLVIEVNRKNRTHDKLNVTGTLTIAGDLNILLDDGAFAAGDVMTILSATSYKGQFESIIPEVPAEGLKWDTSELYTTGLLKVIADGTSIAGVDDSGEIIFVQNGMISVTNIDFEKDITVYDQLGICIYQQSRVIDRCDIPVGKGIYFVRIDQRTVKIIVR